MTWCHAAYINIHDNDLVSCSLPGQLGLARVLHLFKLALQVALVLPQSQDLLLVVLLQLLQVLSCVPLILKPLNHFLSKQHSNSSHAPQHCFHWT